MSENKNRYTKLDWTKWRVRRALWRGEKSSVEILQLVHSAHALVEVAIEELLRDGDLEVVDSTDKFRLSEEYREASEEE